MGAVHERRLISAVLRTGDIRPALDKGITPAHMPNYQDEWAFLLERTHRTRRVPSKGDFTAQFPRWLGLATNDVDQHAGAVAEEHARALMFAVGSRLADGLSEGKPPQLLLEEVNKASRGVAQVLGAGGSVGGKLSDSREYMAEVKRRAHLASNGGIGANYGFTTLDDATGGMTPGHLIIFCARPSVGKSWMLARSAVEAVRTGKRVLFYSLEMNRFSVQTRLISMLSAMDPKGSPFDPSAIRKGTLGRSGVIELRAFMKRQFAPGGAMGEIHIIDSSKERITEYSIQAGIERTQPDVVIVDYLQLFSRINAGGNMDLRLEVARHSSFFKSLGEMYQVPMLTASQLNRSGENKHVPPGLSTLAESDSPGQDADVVITMVPPSKSTRVALVAKNREGPDGDLFRLHFDPSQGRIEEVTAEEAEQIASDETI